MIILRYGIKYLKFWYNIELDSVCPWDNIICNVWINGHYVVLSNALLNFIQFVTIKVRKKPTSPPKVITLIIVHNWKLSEFPKLNLINSMVFFQVTIGRRIGLYRFCGDIGRGNFSKVKLAVHQLTRGMEFNHYILS